MSLLALELSDAGIMVAGGEPPRLLEVDGSETESPGFALAKKKHLAVGKQAEKEAHLYPGLVQHRFWDQLNRDPIKKASGPAENHAEIAYTHLNMIWEKVKPYGDEMIFIVPGFLNRSQMGLLLGIARELSLPVKGFVTQAVSAPPHPFPESRLFYIDMHLHRTEVTLLRQGERLTQAETFTLDESGLMPLYRVWVEALAEEFVRTTRFDPLHKAAYEQELYDRLPGILNHLRERPTTGVDMRVRQTLHHVSVTRDLFLKGAASFFERVRDLLLSAMEAEGPDHYPATLLLASRFSGLPGAGAFFETSHACRTIELEAGACALNLLRNLDRYDVRSTDGGASYITSRMWGMPRPPSQPPPTHLLYRDLAYPISASPLFIGREALPEERTLRINATDVSRKHCSVHREGKDVVLTVYSDKGTYMDENRVEGTTRVTLGQTLRLGNAGETIRFIASLDADEA